MTFAPNALLNCTSKLGVRRNFSNTDPQSPQDKDLFCYDQEGVGYPLPLRKGTMKESHPPFLPPISIVQALLHKTSVQLGPCLCSGWSFPALELTAGDEKKLDDVAADLALWRSPDAPRSVIAVLDSFPAQVLLMAGHSRILGLLIAKAGPPVTKESHEAILVLEYFVERLVCSWKEVNDASLHNEGGFGERKNFNLEGKIATDFNLCYPYNVDHVEGERASALSFRGGLFAVFYTASGCCAESSVAESIIHSIIPYIAECSTLSSPSITLSNISWINTLRFQELLIQACTCTSTFRPSHELNNGVTLPSSAVVTLRLLLEGFERGITHEDSLSLAPPSVLNNLEQLLLHPSVQNALWWAEEDKVKKLSKALMGRTWDNIQFALDIVRSAALFVDAGMESSITETSVVYSQAQIQALLRFLCSVTDERIIQRLLKVYPNTHLDLIVGCGQSARNATLSNTNMSCSLSDDVLSALLIGALCNNEKCIEIIKNCKCPPSLISHADLWARGDEKLLLEIIRTCDHPMPLFRALASCFKPVQDLALARWREKGVELLEWFHSSYVPEADGKPDLMVFLPPLSLSPHSLSTEEVDDLITLLEHSSGVEEKLAAEHLCLALCSVNEYGSAIVERAMDVALQRIYCCGDDFPEHCLEVVWCGVSRQPRAAKYVIGNDATRLIRFVTCITKHPRNSFCLWKLIRDILTWLSFCPASLGPWEPYEHLERLRNAPPILHVPEFCLQYHDILFLAGGKEGDKVAIVKPQNIESWFGQVRPYSDVYKAETRRIRALWKELQTPGFKWFQPEELAVYSRKQLRDARSHSSFSRAIAYARRSMLYNPLVFSRAFLKRGEWYTALGRLLRSRPVTEKDHKVLEEGITLLRLLFSSANSGESADDGHGHRITRAAPLLVAAIRECFLTLLQCCGCTHESTGTRAVLLFLLKLCTLCHQNQENNTAEVLAREILPILEISLSCSKCKEPSELSWIRLELVSRLLRFAKDDSNYGLQTAIHNICTSLPAVNSFFGICNLLASLRCINSHLLRGGCTETILDESGLRGIVCCTVHCCSKIRMMAFAVLSRVPGGIMTILTRQGGPLSLRELCYRVCGTECLTTTVSIANLIWRILCTMEKDEKGLTAVMSIITDALSRDLVHICVPAVSCVLLRILSRALLVHSVEEQRGGSLCDCTAVRESGCLESCVRLAAGIENSPNSIRLQAAWLVRVFSATSCVEGGSMEILKPYASAVYTSIVHERPSDDALKASLCAIAAQLVTKCPYKNDFDMLLEAVSHLLSGRGGILDLEECLGPLRLVAAILKSNTATELYKKTVLEELLSVMTDLYSLPVFQDEGLLTFCTCRLLQLITAEGETSSLSNVGRYERSLLAHAIKAWSYNGSHAGVRSTHDVIQLISCLVRRSPRMQMAALKAGVPKLICETASTARRDLIVPLLHLACNLCANADKLKVTLLRNRSHMPSSILALAINACGGVLDGIDRETEDASFALLQNTASSSCTIALLTHQSAGLEICMRQVTEYGSLPVNRQGRTQEIHRLESALMLCAAAATHRRGAVAIPQSFYLEVPKIFCNQVDRGVLYVACNLLRNTITVIGHSAVPSNTLEALVCHVKQVVQVSGEEIVLDGVATTRGRAMVHLDSCLSLLGHM